MNLDFNLADPAYTRIPFFTVNRICNPDFYPTVKRQISIPTSYTAIGRRRFSVSPCLVFALLTFIDPYLLVLQSRVVSGGQVG